MFSSSFCKQATAFREASASRGVLVAYVEAKPRGFDFDAVRRYSFFYKRPSAAPNSNNGVAVRHKRTEDLRLAVPAQHLRPAAADGWPSADIDTRSLDRVSM